MHWHLTILKSLTLPILSISVGFGRLTKFIVENPVDFQIFCRFTLVNFEWFYVDSIYIVDFINFSRLYAS